MSLEESAGVGSLLLVTLSELFEALSYAAPVFELAAEATCVSAMSPLLRVLATRRSARSEAFDLAGLDSSTAGAPVVSFATLLADGLAGGALEGAAVSPVGVCAAALCASPTENPASRRPTPQARTEGYRIENETLSVVVTAGTYKLERRTFLPVLRFRMRRIVALATPVPRLPHADNSVNDARALLDGHIS